MSNIKLDITKAACFLEAGAVEAFEPKVKAAQQALEDGTCPGNDFLGWLHLPSSITPAFLDELQNAGNRAVGCGCAHRSWGRDSKRGIVAQDGTHTAVFEHVQLDVQPKGMGEQIGASCELEIACAVTHLLQVGSEQADVPRVPRHLAPDAL